MALMVIFGVGVFLFLFFVVLYMIAAAYADFVQQLERKYVIIAVNDHFGNDISNSGKD